MWNTMLYAMCTFHEVIPSWMNSYAPVKHWNFDLGILYPRHAQCGSIMLKKNYFCLLRWQQVTVVLTSPAPPGRCWGVPKSDEIYNFFQCVQGLPWGLKPGRHTVSGKSSKGWLLGGILITCLYHLKWLFSELPLHVWSPSSCLYGWVKPFHRGELIQKTFIDKY